MDEWIDWLIFIYMYTQLNIYHVGNITSIILYQLDKIWALFSVVPVHDAERAFTRLFYSDVWWHVSVLRLWAAWVFAGLFLWPIVRRLARPFALDFVSSQESLAWTPRRFSARSHGHSRKRRLNSLAANAVQWRHCNICVMIIRMHSAVSPHMFCNHYVHSLVSVHMLIST